MHEVAKKESMKNDLLEYALILTVVAITAIAGVGFFNGFSTNAKVTDSIPESPNPSNNEAIKVGTGTTYNFRSTKRDEPNSYKVKRENNADQFFSFTMTEGSARFVINEQTLVFPLPVVNNASYTIHAGDMFLQCDRGRFWIRYPYWWKKAQ